MVCEKTERVVNSAHSLLVAINEKSRQPFG